MQRWELIRSTKSRKVSFWGEKTEGKGWEKIHFWCLLEGLKVERSTNV